MGEIAGIGIDIEELSRFSKYLQVDDKVPGFYRMVFSDEEISLNRNFLPHLTFPLAFSCKEAMFKALGRSWTNSEISWKEIELIFQDKNQPEKYSIRLTGYALERFKALKCNKIDSSFTYNGEHVIFQIILRS